MVGKRVEDGSCFYCGNGLAGLFEVDADGLPICEGCLEDKHIEMFQDDWFWNDNGNERGME